MNRLHASRIEDGCVSAAAAHVVHSDESTLAQEWPFATDFGDHFETPKAAYRDVAPALRSEAAQRGLEPATLRVYDPYYCRGRALAHLNELGFEAAINRRRDFYADIAARRVPRHDVLLTNPPYSGDHKAQLFAWLLDEHRESLLHHEAGSGAVRRSRPFLLLLPAWTAKWLAWRTFLWALARLRKGRLAVTMEEAKARTKKLANLSDELETKAGVFYFAPASKYEYTAAVTARDEAPFFGVWFCGGFDDDAARDAAVAALEKRAAKRAAKSEGGADSQDTRGRVLPTLRALVEAGHVVSVEAERAEALSDPAVRKRRRDAINKLEEERKLKPRHRNYDDRELSKYAPQDALEAGRVEAALKEPQNSRCCRHFFVGIGCTTGAKCRFRHELG